ncbi:hypothetical protein ZIOFF_054427 [Zingiber officinale]|uniref:Uncharacterized protein n=1 Tax=Zingiber officinale TaxID=94328 RepID=A0A8J5FFX5_ZINOF|nr:hypothetical protein ZIOFF_054427 [Zingiber officinale]
MGATTTKSGHSKAKGMKVVSWLQKASLQFPMGCIAQYLGGFLSSEIQMSLWCRAGTEKGGDDARAQLDDTAGKTGNEVGSRPTPKRKKGVSDRFDDVFLFPICSEGFGQIVGVLGFDQGCNSLFGFISDFDDVILLLHEGFRVVACSFRCSSISSLDVVATPCRVKLLDFR